MSAFDKAMIAPTESAGTPMIDFPEVRRGMLLRPVGACHMTLPFFGVDVPWPVNAKILAVEPNRMVWHEWGRVGPLTPFATHVDWRRVSASDSEMTVRARVAGNSLPGIRKTYRIIEAGPNRLILRGRGDGRDSICELLPNGRLHLATALPEGMEIGPALDLASAPGSAQLRRTNSPARHVGKVVHDLGRAGWRLLSEPVPSRRADHTADHMADHMVR